MSLPSQSAILKGSHKCVDNDELTAYEFQRRLKQKPELEDYVQFTSNSKWNLHPTTVFIPTMTMQSNTYVRTYI